MLEFCSICGSLPPSRGVAPAPNQGLMQPVDPGPFRTPPPPSHLPDPALLPLRVQSCQRFPLVGLYFCQITALHASPAARNSVQFLPSWFIQLHFYLILCEQKKWCMSWAANQIFTLTWHVWLSCRISVAQNPQHSCQFMYSPTSVLSMLHLWSVRCLPSSSMFAATVIQPSHVELFHTFDCKANQCSWA